MIIKKRRTRAKKPRAFTKFLSLETTTPKLAYHEGISNIPRGVYWLYISTQRPGRSFDWHNPQGKERIGDELNSNNSHARAAGSKHFYQKSSFSGEARRGRVNRRGEGWREGWEGARDRRGEGVRAARGVIVKLLWILEHMAESPSLSCRAAWRGHAIQGCFVWWLDPQVTRIKGTCATVCGRIPHAVSSNEWKEPVFMPGLQTFLHCFISHTCAGTL